MDDVEARPDTGGAAAAELAVSALLERGGRVVPCPNCAYPVTDHYCGRCGQAVDTHRRSVVHLLHDLVKDVASFDSRILRTARALLFEPGELAVAFREGRTQGYVPAVRLYLFVSLVFFLTLSATRIAIVQFVPIVTPQKIVVLHGHTYAVTPDGNSVEVSPALDDGKPHDIVTMGHTVYFAREGALHPNVPADAIKNMERRFEAAEADAGGSKWAWMIDVARRTNRELATNPAALTGALTAWIPRVLFLLLPLFALVLAAFYWRWRRQFYLVDHLVFSLGFHTFGFVLLLAAAGLAQILPGALVARLTMGVLGLYLILAMRRFYGQSWSRTAVKFIAVSAVYTIFCVGPAMLGIFLASEFYG
jgi:Protein of unknown function (DUF3667)